MAGTQYSRMKLPIGCPGPTRVISSFSSTLQHAFCTLRLSARYATRDESAVVSTRREGRLLRLGPWRAGVLRECGGPVRRLPRHRRDRRHRRGVPGCGGEGIQLAKMKPSARRAGLSLDVCQSEFERQGLPFPGLHPRGPGGGPARRTRRRRCRNTNWHDCCPRGPLGRRRPASFEVSSVETELLGKVILSGQGPHGRRPSGDDGIAALAPWRCRPSLRSLRGDAARFAALAPWRRRRFAALAPWRRLHFRFPWDRKGASAAMRAVAPSQAFDFAKASSYSARI